jgi:hypothetical protein
MTEQRKSSRSATLIVAGYSGDDLAKGARLLAPLRRFGPPLVDLIQPRSYPDFLALIASFAPAGRHTYQPAHSVKQFSGEALDPLVSSAEKFTSPYSAILIHHIHGAVAQVTPEATAFALTEPHYIVKHDAAWEDDLAEVHIAWVQASFAARQPFTKAGL